MIGPLRQGCGSDRSLATPIAELQDAVLVEGTKLALAAARSAEQHTSTVVASSKLSLDSASGGQLSRDSKGRRVGASASAASPSAAVALSLKAALPPYFDAQVSAAQPGAPTKRQRCIDSYARRFRSGCTKADFVEIVRRMLASLPDPNRSSGALF